MENRVHTILRLLGSVGVLSIVVGFVKLYSHACNYRYLSIHPDGSLNAICSFLLRHSDILFVIPLVGVTLGIFACKARKSGVVEIIGFMMFLFALVITLVTLIVWVAQDIPRVNLRGVMY